MLPRPGSYLRSSAAPEILWISPWTLNPATDSGGETLRWSLESQIIPVHAMILLSSVFAQQGSCKWIDFEVSDIADVVAV